MGINDRSFDSTSVYRNKTRRKVVNNLPYINQNVKDQLLSSIRPFARRNKIRSSLTNKKNSEQSVVSQYKNKGLLLGLSNNQTVREWGIHIMGLPIRRILHCVFINRIIGFCQRLRLLLKFLVVDIMKWLVLYRLLTIKYHHAINHLWINQ